MVLPGKVNERWSLDFVSTVFTDGHKYRVLTVIVNFSKKYWTWMPTQIRYAAYFAHNSKQFVPEKLNCPIDRG